MVPMGRVQFMGTWISTSSGKAEVRRRKPGGVKYTGRRDAGALARLTSFALSVWTLSEAYAAQSRASVGENSSRSDALTIQLELREQRMRREGRRM